MCPQDIAEGDLVFRIPMRLALSDFDGDETSEGLTFEGAPWSVRLACRLLRERAAGATSPWFPYIQVITKALSPKSVFYTAQSHVAVECARGVPAGLGARCRRCLAVVPSSPGQP